MIDPLWLDLGSSGVMVALLAGIYWRLGIIQGRLNGLTQE